MKEKDLWWKERGRRAGRQKDRSPQNTDADPMQVFASAFFFLSFCRGRARLREERAKESA